MSKYKISMDMQVLNHLGLNLYSSMPAVISEVVANAWDADAQNVRITISSDSDIIIADDGCGMNLEDINDRFLKVGYRKRNERARTPIYDRAVMGRKGIGKLSLFSIAYNITILSNKNGERNALQIDTRELDAAIQKGNDYNPTELEPSKVDFDGNGTKIILTDLKKRTLSLRKFLSRRLARRFSVIGEQYNFHVWINGNEIKPEDREYLSKAQYLWVYGDEHYKDKLLEQTNDSILKKFFIHKNKLTIGGTEFDVWGWIATSEEPNALKDEDETVNRIAIMVRGKMAKEDILSEFSETGLYAKYVFGEISAEFLDLDEESDITTSNRQDFFEDDERYLALHEFIKEELRSIKNAWIDLRNQLGTIEANKIVVVKEWYDDLGKDDKRAAEKLFGKINQLTVENNEKRELIRHSILAFETLKLQTCLGEFDTISPEDISAFIHAAEVLNSIESSYYYKIVYERLSVIKKMKEVTDENALEKVVQELLSQHLWLLDPAWDRGTESPSVEEAIKTQFDVINSQLTSEEKDCRLDVRYKKASNRHVIIELKRSGRAVRSLELLEQMRKYHSAMSKVLDDRNDKEPFEMIVIIGKKLDGENVHPDTYEKTIRMFDAYNTRIMTYSQLIYNAEKMYSEFIEKNKEAARMFERFISNETAEQA